MRNNTAEVPFYGHSYRLPGLSLHPTHADTIVRQHIVSYLTVILLSNSCNPKLKHQKDAEMASLNTSCTSHALISRGYRNAVCPNAS